MPFLRLYLSRPRTSPFSVRFCSSKLSSILLAMPKEQTHTATLRSQRVKMKEKGRKYQPGIVTLQVLGSGAKGAPRSLYLFTDQQRYLFNCGEGSQRLAHEHKMKLSKLEHIFVTHGSWANLGGLPGVALTIQDVGVPEIALHGPDGIEEIFNATRKFVVLRNLSVTTRPCEKGNVFEDNALTVTYVPLYLEGKDGVETGNDSSEVESGEEDDTDYYYYSKGRSTESKLSPNLRQKVKKRSCSMSYIVRLKPRPGALCLEKCVDAGVPPGPLLGRLKAGEDVVLANGRVIKSSDVTLPDDPGPLFVVVECPDESFLDVLVREEEFVKHQMGGAKCGDDLATLIAHFTPDHIMKDTRYTEWMNRFPPSTSHLILNESNLCMGSSAVHRIQHKLNLIDPSVFPLLNDTVPLKDSMNVKDSYLSYDFSVIRGRTLSAVNLRPNNVFDNSVGVSVDPDEYKTEVMNVDGFASSLNQLKTKMSQLSPVRSEYPNVVFLGTGSCIPNKTRNTSGILLNLREDACMLLDCGEGTYGQMVRFYGRDKVDDVLKRLKAVYISHLHADHHIGLVGILKAISKLPERDSPLFLLAPKQIMSWLNLYNKHFERILDRVQLIPNAALLQGNDSEDEISLKGPLGLHVVTTYVRHCPNAFGVLLDHVDGWKMVYSGDTMPCDSLVEIGKGCDLLIHEATMEDELEDEALLKFHSTISQAVDVGRRMGAGFTMLTHFSQRYAKLPRLSSDSGLERNVGIAFDNMKVTFNDLPKFELFYDTLQKMFQEECDELEQKALKRQLKIEREERKRLKQATPIESVQ